MKTTLLKWLRQPYKLIKVDNPTKFTSTFYEIHYNINELDNEDGEDSSLLSYNDIQGISWMIGDENYSTFKSALWNYHWLMRTKLDGWKAEKYSKTQIIP